MTHANREFEALARPLLELVQRMTGLETSFVTSIDWDGQQQQVLVALNRGELQVAEGSVVSWSDSMCRRTFLRGRDATADVQGDFPGSVGAEQLGMRSFFALPVMDGEAVLGTVCGASRRAVELEPEVLDDIGLIAEALALQLGLLREASLQRARAERAEELAMTDELTGLPNRRSFAARFEQELARASRHGSPLAAVVIDVDRFKEVNDTFGHEGGDRILCAVADAMREVARAGDVAARLGGDEFVLLLPGADAQGAAGAAARIAERFRVATAGLGMPATLSTGTSSSVSGALESLVAAADHAMYGAKAKARGRIGHPR